MKRPIEDRFWEKVVKTDSCWNWNSSIGGNGYGIIHTGSRASRKMYKAHRLSWELHNGPIPDGLWVLHKCDNRLCVNPDHLFLGDRVANMKDCATKGRVCTIGKRNLTHCKHGHEFTPENTRHTKLGHRECLICRDAQNRKTTEIRSKNREAINARSRERYIPAHVRNNTEPAITQRNTSGYRGVSYHKTNKAWKAQIRKAGVDTHIGYFDTPEEAALAYNEYAKKIHGPKALLNKIGAANCAAAIRSQSDE